MAECWAWRVRFDADSDPRGGPGEYLAVVDWFGSILEEKETVEVSIVTWEEDHEG